MAERFIITDIDRVVLVTGKKEYPEKKTVFGAKQLYFHELIYHLSGEATIYFNGEVLHTFPNVVRYLPQGECRQYIVEREKHGECIDICFTSNKPLADTAFVRSVKNEKVATLFKKIFTLWTQKGEQYYLECTSLLYKIIAEIQKTSYLPEEQYLKIKPAVDYIHERFLSDEAITAEKLSAVCGISYSYIKKLFALKYKTSPKRYAVLLKLNYACDLLRCGEYTVSEVAEVCGYKDVYFFSRQFKEHIGVAPTQFIKRYRSSK